MWDTSCRDWEERLLSGRSLVPDLPLHRAEADRALRIYRNLRMPDLIGQPTIGALGPTWLDPIVEALFGSLDPVTQVRAIKTLFALVPKGNNKTTGLAAIMLVAFILNRRANAELLLIGPTKMIADRAYEQASAMIRADAALDAARGGKFKCTDHLREIEDLRPMPDQDGMPNRTVLRVKSADTEVVTGSIAVWTLIDELHELALSPKAAKILLEIRGALTKRPDGCVVYITTQSKDAPVGAFKDELGIARQVRDGEIELPYLPVIYELPGKIAADNGWKDQRYWPLINPNLGKSTSVDVLRDELTKAEATGAHALILFASQYMNVEVGASLSGDGWAGAGFWDRRSDPKLTWDALLARSEIIVVGGDGGGLDDLWGFCALGRDRETQQWLVWSHAWCHRGVLERRKIIASTLEGFARDGDLTIVDDELKDLGEIVDRIVEIEERGLLAFVALDTMGPIGELMDMLGAKGLTADEERIKGCPQGIGLMSAIKTCERKLVNGTMTHMGSRLMAWCVGNLKIEPTATAIKATKLHAGDRKIDPALAMFMAAWGMQSNPESNMFPDNYQMPVWG